MALVITRVLVAAVVCGDAPVRESLGRVRQRGPASSKMFRPVHACVHAVCMSTAQEVGTTPDVGENT